MKSIVICLSVLFLSITSGLVSGEDAVSNSSGAFFITDPVSAPIVVENLSSDCGGVITIPVNINRTAVPAGDVVIAKESPIQSADRVSPGVVYAEFSVESASRNVFLVKTADNISQDSDPAAMTSHSLDPGITCTDENATVLDLLPETFKVKSVEPKSVEQEPVYEVIATKEVRILGLVPVSMDLEMEVNASNGEIEVTKKPWWGFLCSGGV